jgi:ribosome-binding factor A
MQEIRRKRIESFLREKVSSIVLEGELRDPRIDKLVTVTGVKITSDLKEARIFVSVLADDVAKNDTLSILNHASGFIQKRLGKRIRLKSTPKLTFVLDSSLEKGFKINQMLKDLSV